MARIIVASAGGFGDVAPFVALAQGLAARGHVVRFASERSHGPLVERAGLAHLPTRPDPDPAMRLPAAREKLAAGWRGEAFRLGAVVGPGIRAAHEDLLAACRAQGCDLLIGSATQPAAPMAAESHGIPWVPAIVQPIAFLSAHDPPVLPGLAVLARLHGLGRLIGVPARFLAQRAIGLWAGAYGKARRELGLRPPRDAMLNWAIPPPFALALFSRELAAPQPDWLGGAQPTGACQLPDSALQPGVAAFLDAGPPPLVASLGATMSQARRPAWAIYRAILAAAEQAGLRVLLLLGDPAAFAALPRPLPPGVMAVNRAPMQKVLPRAALILHHGGAGTTDLALRAGRPMLVVPFMSDQFDHAARLARLGVAEMLPARRCTEAAIASALPRLLAPPVLARAAALGAKVRAEDGVGAACDVIEAWLRGR